MERTAVESSINKIPSSQYYWVPDKDPPFHKSKKPFMSVASLRCPAVPAVRLCGNIPIMGEPEGDSLPRTRFTDAYAHPKRSKPITPSTGTEAPTVSTGILFIGGRRPGKTVLVPRC
jgi:hypothetical protein